MPSGQFSTAGVQQSNLTVGRIGLAEKHPGVGLLFRQGRETRAARGRRDRLAERGGKRGGFHRNDLPFSQSSVLAEDQMQLGAQPIGVCLLLHVLRNTRHDGHYAIVDGEDIRPPGEILDRGKQPRNHANQRSSMEAAIPTLRPNAQFGIQAPEVFSIANDLLLQP